MKSNRLILRGGEGCGCHVDWKRSFRKLSSRRPTHDESSKISDPYLSSKQNNETLYRFKQCSRENARHSNLIHDSQQEPRVHGGCSWDRWKTPSHKASSYLTNAAYVDTPSSIVDSSIDPSIHKFSGFPAQGHLFKSQLQGQRGTLRQTRAFLIRYSTCTQRRQWVHGRRVNNLPTGGLV